MYSHLGNLTLMTSSSLQIYSDPEGNVEPIHVSGCAQLSGRLLLSYDPSQARSNPLSTNNNISPQKSISLTIMQGNCFNGTFNSTEVSLVNDEEGCWRTENAQVAYRQTGPTIFFSLVNTGACVSSARSIHHLFPFLLSFLFMFGALLLAQESR